MKKLSVCLLFVLAACGDKDDDTGASASDSGSSGGAIDVSWQALYDDVLQPSCTYSTCHEGAGSANLGWDDAASAHEALVGVDSTQLAGTPRVDPGNPEGSYLWMKLQGLEGITGDPMPPGGELDAERMARVEGWIDAGATTD